MAWERDRTPRHWTGFTLIAAALMLATPLWNVWAPAMPDYPAHLASFALIDQSTFHHGARRASGLYHLQWSFVPNLASEVLVPLLAQLTGVVAATKLFLTLALFLWTLGPGAVHRALYGRVGIAPLFGSFFAYNANFTWGFFNYYFASGLSFAIFAAWIATDGRNNAARLIGFTFAVTALYFCHIFAAASLLLMLIGFEVAQNIRSDNRDTTALIRRGARLALLYIPTLLAFLFLKPGSTDSNGVEFNLADTLLDRFESLVEYAFDNSDYVVTIALFGGLALALAFRKARLHPAMWGTLGPAVARRLGRAGMGARRLGGSLTPARGVRRHAVCRDRISHEAAGAGRPCGVRAGHDRDQFHPHDPELAGL
jgi:hypothetical protein